MKWLKEMEWVHSAIGAEDVRVIDCRFDLSDPEKGKALYKQDHLPGAVYFDLEKDLSGPKQVHGGRHPLPDLHEFALKLSEAGIDASTKVVMYDDQGGAMASRMWWMLHYLGHEQSFVMNGSYTMWKEAGFPISTEIPRFSKKQFVPKQRLHMEAKLTDVKKHRESGGIIIDSRERERYLGIVEPIDPVAGHIPGAVNFFWKEVLNESGQWKKSEELTDHFHALPQNEPIIVHCGSGVTACPNVLSLMEAGYTNVRLYVGSWSDWCSYPDNPIEKGVHSS